MVRFKLKTFLLSLIGIVAIATSSAFAYFIFSDEVNSSQVIEDKIKVDNIEENYVFGREDYVGKDYTIYLFPSTLYLEIYQDYLNEPSNIKPEDAFGYIEAIEDSSGNISYKQTLKQSSKGKYRDYVNNNNEYLDNSKRRVAQKGLGVMEYNKAEVYGYQIVYDLEINGIGESGLNGGHNARSDFGEKDDSNGKGVIPTNTSWDDYYIDQNQLNGFDSGEDNYINFNTSKYNNRRHFKNDRFGFWPNLNYDEGRVLPQKIEVFESVSQEDFGKLTTNPWTSMGDKNGWYDLNFAMWVYVDFDSSGNPIYPCTVDSGEPIELSLFKSKDVKQYFDINKSLSGFADKDGIIRLFPCFSNSKGYGGSYSTGGRDAVRMDIYDTNGNKTDRYPMLYFDGTYDGTVIQGVSKTNISYVTNVNINEKVGGIKISTDIAKGPGGWVGTWIDNYDENAGKNVISYIKTNYGLGLYNFYLVIGDSTLNNEKDDKDIYSEFNDIKNINQTITSTNFFSKLYNKNLSFVCDPSDVTNRHITYEELHTTILGRIYYTYYTRPYILLVEKVAEASFYSDLSTSYNTEEELKNATERQVSAPKFYNLNAKLYKAALNSEGAYQVDASSELTTNNSYIYLAQNVDLTETNENLVMQIRFNNEYYNTQNGLYNLNPLGEGEALIFNPSVDTNGNFTFNDDAVFTNASERFKTSSIKITSSGETQNALTLTNFEDNRGIYDIIIEYNKTSSQFNVYTYRHTNIFIKLFENKVSIDENTGLAIHKNADGTDFNYLLWRKQYYLGVNMKASDTCDISFNSTQITFQEAVESFINSNSNTDGYTKQNLLIRDFVTDALIGYFDFDNTGNLVLNLRVMKNYILYFDKIKS